MVDVFNCPFWDLLFYSSIENIEKQLSFEISEICEIAEHYYKFGLVALIWSENVDDTHSNVFTTEKPLMCVAYDCVFVKCFEPVAI